MKGLKMFPSELDPRIVMLSAGLSALILGLILSRFRHVVGLGALVFFVSAICTTSYNWNSSDIVRFVSEIKWLYLIIEFLAILFLTGFIKYAWSSRPYADGASRPDTW